jgi:hypothetical protein
MTEEAQDQAFGRYLAAKKAVAAHGFSENFEEEQSFATVPSSAASDVSVPVVLVYPRVSVVAPGIGKTYIVKYPGSSVESFEIVPATLVTSRGLGTLATFGQGSSMATQQPPTIEDESVEEIIWHVGTTLSVGYRAKLTSRLSELQKAVQEEELDSGGITVRSLKYFIELLRAHPALRCPAVSVTPDRNIYASWKLGSDHVFSIHFLPDGKVRFVIFCPNEKHPGESIRLSGTATVDVVMSIAAPHGVLSWASDDRPANSAF